MDHKTKITLVWIIAISGIIILVAIILVFALIFKPEPPSPPLPPPAINNTLVSGNDPNFNPRSSYLVVGQALYSQDRNTWLTQQADGNLVLYKFDTAIWNTGIPQDSTNHNVSLMQCDGNFVMYNDIYDTDSPDSKPRDKVKALWASNNYLLPAAPEKPYIGVYTLSVEDGYFTISNSFECFAYAPFNAAFKDVSLCTHRINT
jgi:hypothetical protein